MLTAAGVDPAVTALVCTEFCGALTTYSTFAYETFGLAVRRVDGAAAANLAGSRRRGAGGRDGHWPES